MGHPAQSTELAGWQNYDVGPIGEGKRDVVSIKRLRDRLPSSVGDAAYDSAWTFMFEGFLIATVTASFLMLGRELGPEGYGEYVGLFAIITPVSSIGAAATLSTLQAFFQEQRPVEPVVNTFMTIVFVGGTLATVVVGAVAPLILDELTMTAILTISYGELVLVPMVRVASGGIRALHGVPASVRLEMLVLAARFSVLAVLFGMGGLTVERVGIGWFTTSFLVVSYVLFVRLPREKLEVRPVRVRMRDLRLVGALGAPMYISDFQTNGDKAVLIAVDRRDEAGLYGAAFRVATLALTPLRAMDIAIFHRFLEHDDNARGVHLRRARRYSLWSVSFVSLVALGLVILAPLLKFIVGEDFSESVTMTRWLALWLPLKQLAQPPLSGLLGLGRLGLRLLLLTLSAGLAMLIYIVLIPDMGWEGAVIGTVIAEAFLAMLAWAALYWAQGRRDAELAVHAAKPGEPSFSA